MNVPLGSMDMAGWLALIAFVVALGIQTYLVLVRPDRLWWAGRAAAESVKTLTWRYVVGGQPFPVSLRGQDADALFLFRLKEILTDLGDLPLIAPASTPPGQITTTMRKLREQSLQERVRTYRDDRVRDQFRWYSQKARQNNKRVVQFTVATIALESLGVLLATLKAFTAVPFDLLGPVAALAAAVAAWQQMRQHTTLAQAYSVASQELATIDSTIADGFEEHEWSQFVQDAEEAMSREHTLWRASRGLRP